MDAGDAGNPNPVDAGDAGNPTPVDAGDAGNPTPVDAGDAGNPNPVDAGDAGVPVDAGNDGGVVPPVDAGNDGGVVPPVDAGNDGGVVPPVDAGNDGGVVPPVDAGNDGGVLPPVDSGVEPDPLLCGNGVMDPGEQCDDGSQCGNGTDCTVEGADICPGAANPNKCRPRDNDGCSDTCQLEVCGDEIVNASIEDPDGGPNQLEECDDGPFVVDGGDGDFNSDIEPNACRTDCVLPFCGDDVTDDQFGELCDGDTPMTNCSEPGEDGGPGCIVIDGCGDNELDDAHPDGGIPAEDEECDDGNAVDGDGCTSECVDEFCGDQIVNDDDPNTGFPEETCDDGIADGGPCPADCISQVCGDGFLSANEECDPGDADDPALGNIDPDGCSSTCQINSFCGDGEDFTEDAVDGSLGDDATDACDDGNRVSGDGCDEFCQPEDGCGDGNLDNGEECDPGDRTDQTDGCSNTCQLLNGCGNGVVGPGEQCDDDNIVNGDTCSSTCVLLDGCGDGDTTGNTTPADPDFGEQCDDGRHCANGAACVQNSDCTDASFCIPRGGDGCEPDCTFTCGTATANKVDIFNDNDLPDGGNGTGNCYASYTTTQTWQAAEAFCESIGGHLVVPDTGDENYYISSTNRVRPTAATPFWIGIHDQNEEASTDATLFVAVTGDGTGDIYDAGPGGTNINFDTLDYENFGDAGQPNDPDGGHDCVIVAANGNTWDDVNCATPPRAFICEIEATTCGDNIQQTVNGEECDGTDTPVGATCGAGDGCQILTGCGDGAHDDDGLDNMLGTADDEECDSGDAVEGGFDGFTGKECTANCKVADGCGDGDFGVDTGEECDPGNLYLAGDGCSDTCQIENGCGDGFVDTNGPDDIAGNADDEECDWDDPATQDACTLTCELLCFSGEDPDAVAVDETSGKCFGRFSGAALTWSQARTACAAAGGELAAPDDVAEDVAVDDVFSGSTEAWIGVNDINPESSGDPNDFQDVNDAFVTYHDFAGGQPDGDNAENCVELLTFGGEGNNDNWNDADCLSTNTEWICEEL